MEKKLMQNTNNSCLKCKYHYTSYNWFEPAIYCSKYNIEGNLDVIGLRNYIPAKWVNNGLCCRGLNKDDNE